MACYPVQAGSASFGILADGLNPFHMVLGQEFLPLGFFHEGDFWGHNFYGEPVETFVTTHGIIHVKFKWGYRMDMTLNKGVRIVNEKSKIAISISPDGKSSAIIHPIGCLYQVEDVVDVKINSSVGCHKYAQLTGKGITFRNKMSPLIYKIDNGGVRTTNGCFNDFGQDMSVAVVHSNAMMGPSYLESGANVMRAAVWWQDWWGTDHWLINGIKISQSLHGALNVVYGENGQFEMKTSDLCGTASLMTPLISGSASIGGINNVDQDCSGPHFYVRQGNKWSHRVHSDGLLTSFRVGVKHDATMDLVGNLTLKK